MFKDFWTTLRRSTLCRFGVHYDAARGRVANGASYICCYDCGMLRHFHEEPSSVVRELIIQRHPDRLLSMTTHRTGA